MAKKEYFGEKATAKKTERKAKTERKTETPKRKYTRRKTETAAIGDLVSIQVPASMAYQVGLVIGRSFAEARG